MKRKSGSMWLGLAALLSLVFVANIALGKAALSPDFEAPFLLSDVQEFLLLFSAVVCFVSGTLCREAEREKQLENPE